MYGTHFAPALSRRNFILTAASAAGGFMIGIGAAPHVGSCRHRPGPALGYRQRLLAK